MTKQEVKQSLALDRLDFSTVGDGFVKPKKKIHESDDVTFFLTSKAYTDLLTFMLQLNASMFPRHGVADVAEPQPEGAADVSKSGTVAQLRYMLSEMEDMIEQAPPDPGPRRFGNVSFRKWFDLVESNVDRLLDTYIPEKVTQMVSWSEESLSPKLELKAYLLGSLGSAQRLDYGTGHELSFLAFLGCIWKLHGFESPQSPVEGKDIVKSIITKYLDLIRCLIKTYNLEPAGSHGVWGLDDHSFLPYIFGSAQLSPAIPNVDHIPAEGSATDAPDPGDVVNMSVVEQQRRINMYFGAIGFIYDVKKGPFWEHSPVLYDISGVKKGWAKINAGLIKMYIAEVLSKFPVVQHFPFGSLFQWEKDANAPPSVSLNEAGASASTTGPSAPGRPPHPALEAVSSIPSPRGGTTTNSGTPAPWKAGISQTQATGMPQTMAPWASGSPASARLSTLATESGRQPPLQGRRAPTIAVNPAATKTSPQPKQPPPQSTRAPWAKDSG